MSIDEVAEAWRGTPGQVAWSVARSLNFLLTTGIKRDTPLSKAELKWAGAALQAFGELSSRKPEQMQPVFAALYAKRPRTPTENWRDRVIKWLPRFDNGLETARRKVEERKNNNGGGC